MALNPGIHSWAGRRVWIVGASTGIGQATARALHALGAQVIVSARNAQALQALTEAHPGMRALAMDATQRTGVQAATQALLADGPIDLVAYFAGTYTAQRATAFDLDEMLRHQQVNYVGALHLLDAMLPAMLARRSGHISLVSSVAGYRGLPQSLAYGPTKAALINLAETLHHDLAPVGIGVSLINPGFVETPLTAQNRFEMPGLITADQAAAYILEGWRKGRFEMHFPRRFTFWMKLLRILPYRLYFMAIKRFTGL